MFVIKKRGTENYILVTGRGSTHHEASPLEQGSVRIFNTVGAARGFLTVWCKGALSVHRSWYMGEEDENWSIDTKLARNPADYAIYPVTLQLGDEVAAKGN